ncbi:MAG: acyl carrier protein [Clostridia bacterium]|nr:acyl carrier protein [Clostridia bacterium]MBR5721179.1 acyl carrier protein [Clostridia bacterium]
MYFEKVAALISEKFEMPVENITRETSIIDDLGADSLDIVDMLMMLEDQYNISIPDEVAQEMKTVGDVADYIEENA